MSRMTESQWLACTDPVRMKWFLQGKASPRKMRLFDCACCRRIWRLLTDQRSRRAVEVAERHADGEADDDLLTSAFTAADRAIPRTAGLGPESAFHAALVAAAPPGELVYTPLVWLSTSEFAATAVLYEAYGQAVAGGTRKLPAHVQQAEKAAQAALLRDLFGNPFRTTSLDPVWTTWHDGLPVKMAAAIYAERRFEDLPILADALEEAGCEQPDVLAHCRGPGGHARGCWVVDLILSKDLSLFGPGSSGEREA
jgi:hypothetical protein